ncbi:hypothetical protein [Actinoallomurus iriomotensis]|nr:hypothetical protein [Actinoallomurus iriomotensis]
MAAVGYTKGDPSKVDVVTVGEIGGPAGPLDADGLIPAGQIPGGGGGGGGGVSIGGDLGGTTSSPQVIATHLSSPLPLIQGGTGGGSASAARTSLGLGGAALLDVGTATGTVAAGDDSRLTNARTPTAHASSHAAGGSDAVTPASIGAATDHGYNPADYGLLAWVGDPGYLAGAVAVPAGIVHLMKIKIPKAMTITNLVFYMANSITLTSGQNFAAVFDTSGTRLGITADQSSNWATAGSKVCALTSPAAVSAGFVYAAILFNGSSPPQMGRYGQNTIYDNASIGSLVRFGQYGSGLTAMPTSLTMGSMTANSTAAFWAGAS